MSKEILVPLAGIPDSQRPDRHSLVNAVQQHRRLSTIPDKSSLQFGHRELAFTKLRVKLLGFGGVEFWGVHID